VFKSFKWGRARFENYQNVETLLAGGNQMKIDSLDHVVFTVKDIDTTCKFYAKVLGMEIVAFGENRKALSFGSQKINLQQLGHESTLKAEKPTPGSADVCFITSVSLSDVSNRRPSRKKWRKRADDVGVFP